MKKITLLLFTYLFFGLYINAQSHIPQFPAGVQGDVKLWLKANKGVIANSSNIVSQWNGQSVNSKNAIAINTPTKVDDAINFNPVISFNGLNSGFEITNGILGTDSYDDMWVYTVQNVKTLNNSVLFRETISGGNRFGSHLPWGDGTVFYDFGVLNSQGRIQTNPNTIVTNKTSLWTLATSTSTDTPSGFRKNISENGKSIATSNNNNSSENRAGNNSNFYLGVVNSAATGFDYHGDIAEMIIYGSKPTEIEQRKIQSYLAIKYGITLDNSAGGDNGDYIASNSTLFWDASFNTAYHNNVTIIAKDEASELHQPKSKNNQPNAILTVEKVGGISGNLKGIAVGSNNQTTTFTRTNAPTGYNITNRKWLMQVRGDLTDISMSFEIPNNTGVLSDYKLLTGTSDTNFSATAPSFNPTSISGDTITFTNVATNIFGPLGTAYFVIAETSNPKIQTFLPANNSTDIPVTDNLEITFNENVVDVSGNITIYNASDNSVFETISVNSPNVSISFNKVTINPTKDLENNNYYYIEISSGAFRDVYNNTFNGISNTTTWSFSTAQGGPAGITSGLQLWLKANEGITVNESNAITQWKDKSSYSRIATPVKTPTLATHPINSNNAIHFDGTGAGFQISGGILGTNTYSDVWVYTVQNVDRLTSGYIFREDMADGNRITAHLPWSNGYAYYDFGVWNGLGRVQTNTSAITINETDLWTLASSTSTSTPSGFRKSISKNGLTIASNNTDNTTESRTGNNSDFFVGIQTASGGGAYHGDIAEMIVYTSKPTAVEQQKIQSYLAIKYGITLDKTDNVANITEGNYLNSSGTIIWNTINNASYHNNITVITKDVSSGLQQNESKSINENVFLSVGKSGGIINDKDAIAVGSNNQPFTMSPANAPKDYNISSRVWKMQKTGNLNNIIFRFDIPSNTGNITDYQVIMSSSPTNFSTGITVFPATSIVGNSINVDNISTVNGNYYVLAQKTVNQSISLSPNTIVSTLADQFNFPQGVASDNAGNFYVADANSHQILRISATGIVYIIAGSGTAGFADGPGTIASFNKPYDVAVDKNGFVYVADRNNHSIRKIAPNGRVSTVTGFGESGFADGTPSQAKFGFPTGIAVDNDGNLYVADFDNSKIRKITPAGVTSTLAGSSRGFADGTGSSARFNYPTGVALDSLGNVYVADTGNHRIRKIKSSGVVTTYAGSSSSGYRDGIWSSARFNFPTGVVVDAQNNIYVADRSNSRIRKISSTRIVTTVAGNGNFGLVNGVANTAEFSNPISLTLDKFNNIYVMDSGNNALRKIKCEQTPTFSSIPITSINEGNTYNYPISVNDIDGDVVNLAATSLPSWLSLEYFTSNAVVSSVTLLGRLNFPQGIASDNAGNFYVADTNNHQILRISATGIIYPLAGSGRPGFQNGFGTSASFNKPYDVAVDNNGNVFVADRNNHSIRKIAPNGFVSTFTGFGQIGFADGTPGQAKFNFPTGIAVDNAGTIYVADLGNNRIRKITTSGLTSTLAGSAEGFKDGTGVNAQFSYPEGVAVDAFGTVYVADTNNHRIRKITPSGVVTTYAGSSSSGHRDGLWSRARFNFPTGVVVDPNNNIYVADRSNQRIRKILSNRVVTTIAGNGNSGLTNGTASTAEFSNPISLTLDKFNNIYVIDAGNEALRVIKDHQTPVLFGTTNGQKGTYNVVLQASDTNGNSTQQSFTVTVSDITAPTIASVTPTHNSTINSTNSNLEMIFSEDVIAGTGNISIYNQSDDSLVETIALTSTKVSITNNKVTITPSNLTLDEIYYINIDGTAFKDIANNNFLGISDQTTWVFSIERPTNNYIASTGNWSVAGSWSLGRTPLAMDNISVLASKVGTNNISNLEVHNFNNLGTTTINKLSAITVNRDFTNSGTLNVISDANDSGVLLVKGSSTGSISYNRGGLLANKWNIVTAPVKGDKVLSFVQNAANDIRINTVPDPDRYAMATYNDGNAPGTKWQYYNANTNANVEIDITRGYLISRATDGSVVFTGTLHTTNFDRGVSANLWNTIGSPFATYYPINKNSNANFLNDNSSKLDIPALYIWNNIQEKYVAITNLVISTEQFLPPGQGFFVRPNANTTLLFDSNKRSLKPASGVHTFNKASNTTPYIKLYVEKGNIKINTDIIYSSTATKGFDKNEDIENFDGASFDVNSHLVENSDGKNYTIQSLPKKEIANLVVPLSINGLKNDNITFSIETTDFPAEVKVYLEDKLTNQFIRLDDTNAEYRITLDANTEGIGRFYLHTSSQVLSTSLDTFSNVHLYKYDNNTVRVTGLLNENATLMLYTVLGQKVFKTSFIGELKSGIHLPNLEAAVYIVEIQTEKGKVSKKIIIE